MGSISVKGGPKAATGKNKTVVAKVRKTMLKSKLKKSIPSHAVLQYTGKGKVKADFVKKRCKRCDSKEVQACLGMRYRDRNGTEKIYNVTDLRYDLAAGSLKIKK